MIENLRYATIDDADILLQWRNDPQTQEASHNSKQVFKKEHIEWLKGLLSDKNRKLFIYEIDKRAIGTARADWLGNKYELSWTIAPNKRGKGYAKRMVQLLASSLSGALCAQVKEGNVSSSKIAEYIGLEFKKTKNGIKYYEKSFQ